MMQFSWRVICVTHSRMHPFIVLLCVSFTRGALIGPKRAKGAREMISSISGELNKLIFIDRAAFLEEITDTGCGFSSDGTHY